MTTLKVKLSLRFLAFHSFFVGLWFVEKKKLFFTDQSQTTKEMLKYKSLSNF